MNKLTKDHFSYKCPMNWDAMTPSANGRFCDKCSKEVYDLTHCSLDQVRELQHRHGSICGMIRVMGAAAVAASLSTAACRQEEKMAGVIAAPSSDAPISKVDGVTPPPPTGKDEPKEVGEIDLPVDESPPKETPPEPEEPHELPPPQPPIIMGIVCPPPQAPVPPGDVPG
ncbi:MAG TPA: hypothetical protein VFY13_03040 [Luteolibacter sp.]|nr:hypothetical protein [Luteolibacter sp.]